MKGQLELDCSDMASIPVKGSGEKVDNDALWGLDSIRWESDMKHWDGVSGKIRDGRLVQEARMEEIRAAEAMGVWRTVPRTEAYATTGKAPIGTRWVDTDNGDRDKPKVRSRLVARERKTSSELDIIVATPHRVHQVCHFLGRKLSVRKKGLFNGPGHKESLLLRSRLAGRVRISTS